MKCRLTALLFGIGGTGLLISCHSKLCEVAISDRNDTSLWGLLRRFIVQALENTAQQYFLVEVVSVLFYPVDGIDHLKVDQSSNLPMDNTKNGDSKHPVTEVPLTSRSSLCFALSSSSK